MPYSYDRRKTAGAFFNNFQPVPRRATSGSSLSDLQARVRHLHDEVYTMHVEIRGTLKGQIQTVADEMVFAGIEMREFCGMFFRKPPPMTRAEVISISDQTATIAADGLSIETNVDFKMLGMTPEEVRQAVEAGGRLFANQATVQME